MSGERILLADGSPDHLTKLLGALGTLETISHGEHALGGGLTVMCRLWVAHRATEDLDQVTGSISLADGLGGRPAKAPGGGRRPPVTSEA